MAPRKSLTERIGLVAAKTEEPPVKIPPADPVKARSESAKEGIMAVERLAADVNYQTRRADQAELEVQKLLGINNNQRERTDYWQRRCEHLIRVLASVSTLAPQICGVANEMYRLLAEEAALVQRMEPKLTNAPDAPMVEEEQFDHNGIPYNSAPRGPSAEELKQVIERLGQEGHA